MEKGFCPICKDVKVLGYLGRCTSCNVKIQNESRRIKEEYAKEHGIPVHY